MTLTLAMRFDGDPAEVAQAVAAVCWQYPIPDDWGGSPNEWAVAVVGRLLTDLVASHAVSRRQVEIAAELEAAREGAPRVTTTLLPPPETTV